MGNNDQIIAHPSFLITIDVIDDRGLRIVLEEKTRLGPPEKLLDLELTSREFVRDQNDGIFEIAWPVVACFAVRGDPFPKGRPSTSTIIEEPTDTGFMQWVKSSTRCEPDYVAAMGGEDAHDRKLRHWVISCHEIHVDVAAIDPPTVGRI